MTPARALARLIAVAVMIAATVAALMEARPAWILFGAAVAAAFTTAV